jgi:hypothetical protein
VLLLGDWALLALGLLLAVMSSAAAVRQGVNGAMQEHRALTPRQPQKGAMR